MVASRVREVGRCEEQVGFHFIFAVVASNFQEVYEDYTGVPLH